MIDSAARPFRNRVAERADIVARWTGIGRLIEPKKREPRTLRWWPLVLLVIATAGYALIAIDGLRHHDGRLLAGILGYTLLYGSFGMATVLRVLGPRLIGSLDHPLDERERMIKARAGHIGGTVIAVATMGGCFYFGLATPFGLWVPDANGWVALGFLIETWWFTLPVLVASWLQARPPGDD